MRKLFMMALLGVGMLSNKVARPAVSAVSDRLGSRTASLDEKREVIRAAVQSLMCPPKDRNDVLLIDAPDMTAEQWELFRTAQLAAEEDDDFLTRPSLPSWRGLARALFTTVAPWRRAVGGSGLGQEFVRNLLARFWDPRKARERTLFRKMDEWLLTSDLDVMLAEYEPDLTKRRTLLLHLTALVFESGMERPANLEGAAHRFFSRPVGELSDKELVALVAAQTRPVHFLEHPGDLEKRTAWVLGRMGHDPELSKPLRLERGEAAPTAHAVLNRWLGKTEVSTCGDRLSIDHDVQEAGAEAIHHLMGVPLIQKKYGGELRLTLMLVDDQGISALATNSLTDVLKQRMPIGSLEKLVLVERCIRAAPELEVPTGDVVLADQSGTAWAIKNYSPPTEAFADCSTIASASINASAARLAVLLPDLMSEAEVSRYQQRGVKEPPVTISTPLFQELYGEHYAASPGDLGLNARVMTTAAYVKARTEDLVGEGPLDGVPLRPAVILGVGELTPTQILAYAHNLFWRSASLHSVGLHGIEGAAGGPKLTKLGAALASVDPKHATYRLLLEDGMKLPAKTGTAGGRAALLVFGVLVDGRPTTGLVIAWREGEGGLDQTADGSRGIPGGILTLVARDLLNRLGDRVRSPT